MDHHRALLGAPEGGRALPVDDLERPKDPEFHGPETLCPSQATGNTRSDPEPRDGRDPALQASYKPPVLIWSPTGLRTRDAEEVSSGLASGD
jgi:hypothetical protein